MLSFFVTPCIVRIKIDLLKQWNLDGRSSRLLGTRIFSIYAVDRIITKGLLLVLVVKSMNKPVVLKT